MQDTKILVYHGGYIEINEPRIIRSKFNKDFGFGFYCTEIENQARRWAMRFDTQVVSVYEYMPSDALNIMNFREMSDNWLDFIASCRHGEGHDYDIVTGAMANDQVWNYVADYLSGVLTREQFWVLAKFKQPTHQIAFCTEKAFAHLKFIKSYEVKP